MLLSRCGIYKQLWTLELRQELSVSAPWSNTQEEFLGEAYLFVFYDKLLLLAFFQVTI